LTQLSMRADDLYGDARRRGAMQSPGYRAEQHRLYAIAVRLVESRPGRDRDD